MNALRPKIKINSTTPILTTYLHINVLLIIVIIILLHALYLGKVPTRYGNITALRWRISIDREAAVKTHPITGPGPILSYGRARVKKEK